MSSDAGAEDLALGGFDLSKDGNLAYVGTIVPFAGGSIGRGPAVRLWADYNTYGYTSSGQVIDAKATGLEVALAHQVSSGENWGSISVGVVLIHFAKAPPDRVTSVPMKGILAVAAAALTLYGCGGEYAQALGRSRDGASGTIVRDLRRSGDRRNRELPRREQHLGKGKLRRWSQCIGRASDVRGGVIGRWRWNWSNPDGHVAAYPEVIFGQKPGKSTTSPIWPRCVRGDARVAHLFPFGAR